MRDIFSERNIKPMLIGASSEPFDDKNYIYELKLDGERCVAYIDKNDVEFKNKRNMKLNSKVPELLNVFKQVKAPCILDGELIVLVDGKPDFSEIQRRSLMSNSFKIKLAADEHPASFIAFDILYSNNNLITDLPLIERKNILQTSFAENERMAISRHIEEKGVDFYKLAEQQELEGIVAKLKDSKYYFGKKTNEWIKIKRLFDDDFVVCGYIPKENNVVSLVLGQYNNNNQLIYKGHVPLGISSSDFKVLAKHKKSSCSLYVVPNGNENAIWLSPDLVCIVQWMPRKNEALNQPVFKGLRYDKIALECKGK